MFDFFRNDDSFRRLQGYALDGELIPVEKRKAKKEVKYFYFVIFRFFYGF